MKQVINLAKKTNSFKYPQFAERTYFGTADWVDGGELLEVEAVVVSGGDCTTTLMPLPGCDGCDVLIMEGGISPLSGVEATRSSSNFVVAFTASFRTFGCIPASFLIAKPNSSANPTAASSPAHVTYPRPCKIVRISKVQYYVTLLIRYPNKYGKKCNSRRRHSERQSRFKSTALYLFDKVPRICAK